MLRPVPSGRADPAAEQGASCVLGVCDGSGWLLDEESNSARPCACREQRVRRAASGDLGAGIGRRFLEVSFEREPVASLDRHIVRHVRGFIRSLDDHLDAGRGLWFDGPVGTGKTSLAILVAKAARAAGRTHAFFTVPLLLAEIKRTYDRDSGENYLDLFRRLCSVDLLVLDDLGAEKQTEWVLEQLYSIVNERWQDKRAIVVTTNLPDPDPEAPLRMLREQALELRERSAGARPDQLGEIVGRLERVVGRLEGLEVANEADPIARLRRQVGSRTVSRLVEICDDPIPVAGPDLRMAAHGA